jgi:hypothetical protein
VNERDIAPDLCCICGTPIEGDQGSESLEFEMQDGGEEYSHFCGNCWLRIQEYLFEEAAADAYRDSHQF